MSVIDVATAGTQGTEELKGLTARQEPIRLPHVWQISVPTVIIAVIRFKFNDALCSITLNIVS